MACLSNRHLYVCVRMLGYLSACIDMCFFLYLSHCVCECVCVHLLGVIKSISMKSCVWQIEMCGWYRYPVFTLSSGMLLIFHSVAIIGSLFSLYVLQKDGLCFFIPRYTGQHFHATLWVVSWWCSSWRAKSVLTWLFVLQYKRSILAPKASWILADGNNVHCLLEIGRSHRFYCGLHAGDWIWQCRWREHSRVSTWELTVRGACL